MADDIGQGNGASLRDRATPAEPVVSALREGIPSAWEPIEYEGGYPVDEEFAALEGAEIDFYAAAQWLLSELPVAAENMPCFCSVENRIPERLNDRPARVISFSTGGWSGAESIASLIERRFDLSYFMQSWRRGGHYVFEIPVGYLSRPAQSDRSPQGGDAQTGSIADESRVAEGDAPNSGTENPTNGQ